jgi:uncharacterized protein (TIGR03435 family)
MAAAALIAFGVGGATESRAHAQSQNAAAAAPALVFEYEVASIKPYKPGDSSGRIMMGIMNAPDSLTASGVTLQMLVQIAYGVQSYQISGGPDWVNTDRFEIDAKMDGSVAEALAKLSNDDRNLARQHMLQALLADRFKLTIRRETKELPVYTLIIGKNGSKLKEATPEEIAASTQAGRGTPPAPGATRGGGGGGRRGPGPGGVMMTAGRGGTRSMTGQAVSIAIIVRTLSQALGRPVLDKTGLAGMYDYTLEWTPDDNQLQAAPGSTVNGQAAPAPADQNGPNIFTAVQEQLGLKLESGKGPVETIVIDHVEKASDN